MLIKRQTDILTDMMDYTASMTNKITDYSVGSVIRSIYDAVSIENEMLYLMTFNNIQEGIESGLMSAFNFSPKAAVKAHGDLTIVFYTALATPLILSKGTRFTTGQVTDDRYYETTSQYTIPAGTTTATIQVQASIAGQSGNVLSGEITQSNTSLYNVSQVYNQYPFLTGSDEETYDEARDRFNKMILSIGRGTNAAILYGALSVEDIQLAKLDEFVGYVNLYVGDANGSLTDDQSAEVSSVIDNYRSAGIKVNVYPITRTALDVTMNITVNDTSYLTDGFKLSLQKYVYDYINSLPLNSDFIYNDFIRYTLNFDSGLIWDVSVTTPSGNYVTGSEEVVRAGNINITYSGR